MYIRSLKRVVGVRPSLLASALSEDLAEMEPMSPLPQFHKGENVTYKKDQSMGLVETSLGFEEFDFWYRVRIGARIMTVAQSDLRPLDQNDDRLENCIYSGRWGSISALRSAIAVARLKHEDNRSTLYSFRAQRILFQPHQYKPLLRLLDSPDRRLLIADEVGLGKTIEAGLILTELEARNPLKRVLIVCPAPLRDKWKKELNGKFGQDFELFDRNRLREYLDRNAETGGQTTLRAIISLEALREEELLDQLEVEIAEFDFVVIDEAHKTRNTETLSHATLRMLCRCSRAIVLLTATPIQLGNQDLFHLLTALRPTEFPDQRVFDDSLQRHRELHAARLLARQATSEGFARIAQILTSVFRENGGAWRDPRAERIVKELGETEPTGNEEIVRLERQLQDLHPLASILTRASKRDVQQDAAIRRAKVISCEWSAEEFDDYTWATSRIPSKDSGDLRGIGGMQFERQAASCLPALIRKLTGSTERCAKKDSKYDQLHSLLKKVWSQEPKAKVLVFAQFRGTVEYLHERLTESGINSLFIHGKVISTPLNRSTDERGERLRRFQKDPAVQVLISSEIGSEGLDFQFCHHLVNYDLPWNPMVIEQRIGRVDRFGQKSPVVEITSFVIEGTIESKILARLYERIGVFRESLGDMEVILGEQVRSLQSDYEAGRLTMEEAERRSEQIALAVERAKADTEELTKKAAQLIGWEDYISQELRRVGHLGRYLSEKTLISLIESYVKNFTTGSGVFWDEQSESHQLRLTNDIRQALHRFSNGGRWNDRGRDDYLRFTADGEKAFHDPTLDLINANHPLVRAAVEAFEEKLSHPLARIGGARIEFDELEALDLENPPFPAGFWLIAVFEHEITGYRERRLFDVVGINVRSGELMVPDQSERLLYLATERGEDFFETTTPPKVMPEHWQIIESEILRRHARLKSFEKEENEAIILRQLETCRKEHELDQKGRQTRMKSAQENGRLQAVPLFQRQISKAETEHAIKLEELNKQRDSFSTGFGEPVAVCLVHVRHTRGWEIVNE